MGQCAPDLFAVCALVALVSSGAVSACKAKTTGEAEANRDVSWLADNASPEAMAALGRLADSDPRAVAVLEKRSAMRIARSPKLEARPTAQSWSEFGERLVQQIAAILTKP